METSEYRIKMEMPYMNMDPFKQKSIHIVIDTIGYSTLATDMVFESYGIAESQDKQMTDIIVTPISKFTRGKINCIIYHLRKTAKNPGVYNKCVIYYTATDPSYYGYIMFNTETGKQLHKYNLEFGDDYLCRYLKASIASIQRNMFFDFYSKRFDELKEYNNKPRHIMCTSDYNNLIKKWKTFVSKDHMKIY